MGFLKKFIIGLVLFALIVPLSSIPIPAKAAVDTKGFITKEKKIARTSETELTEQRTIYSKTFLKPDGSKRLESSLEPLHYQVDENGKKILKDINNNMQPKGILSQTGAKVYKNTANSFELNFTDNLIEDGVSISQSQQKINLKPQKSFALQATKGISSVENIISGSLPKSAPKTTIYKDEATFSDAGSAIEYTYKSTSMGVKEEIRLNRLTADNIFYFDLNLENLTYENKNGIYYFTKAGSKDPVFYMLPSYAYDSNFDKPAAGAEDSVTYNVTNEIVKVGEKNVVKVTVDKSWLLDKKRSYPIIIDPTIGGGLGGWNEDSFVQERYHDSRYVSWDQTYLYTGYTGFYNNGVWVNKGRTRTLLPFSVPNSLGNRVRVTGARVSAYQRMNIGNHGILGRMTTDYNGQNVYWDNQPGYSGETVYNQNGCTNCWIDVDVTQLAKYWYESNVTNFKHGYLAFWDDTDGDGTTDTHYRQWLAQNSGSSPQLSVDYIDYNAEYSFNNIHNAKVGDPYSLSVNVHNLGSDWIHSGNSVIDLEFYKNGQPYAREELGVGDIPPGGWTTVSYNNRTFSEPGNYTVYTDLYNGDFGWYSLFGVPQAQASFTISDYPDYAALYQPVSVPSTLVANSTTTIPINIQNGSRSSWPVGQYNVSYHWIDNATGDTVVKDGLQTSFKANVDYRGGWGTADMQVRAPFNAGSYKLKIDMIQGGTNWFSDRGIPTKDYNINITPASFSSLTRLGTEDYYAKAGPVDLATGNLSYSSTDMTINSNTGLLSVERSFNANSLDQMTNQNGSGYIQNWLVNGPYKENDQTIRMSKKYIANEETIRPNTNSSSNGKLWFKANTNTNILDINQILDTNGVVQSGYANNSVVYANTYVYSPINQIAKLKVGSDDGEKVWLNGSLISNQDVYRSFTIDQDSVDATLKQGWNSLLVKVSQKDSSWLLSTKFINPTTNAPLSGLKYAFDNQEIFGDYQLLGKGWTTNFNEKLFSTDENNIYYRDSTGSVNLFTKKSDGTYQRPTGTSLNLAKNTDGTFSVTSKSGLKINFNLLGRLSNKTDLSGNSIAYQYDTSGNCIKIMDGSRFIAMTYTGDQLSTIVDGLGNKYLYSFDNSIFPARLTKVTDPAGNFFSYTYNDSGKMRAFTDKNGAKTDILYDDSGNKVWIIQDATNNATGFTYDGNKTIVNDALDHKSTAEFDKNGLLTGFTNAKGYREIYQYDGNYNVTTIIPDIAENQYSLYNWYYTYDSNDNLLTATDPMTRKSSYVYSGNDLIKSVDPDGSTNEFIYSSDGKRLLLSEKDPKGNITSYSYDSLGRKVSVTDPEQNITRSTYSAGGDVATIVSPKNETSTFVHDLIGRKISDKSPLGKTTTYQYNPLGQITKITDPNGLSIMSEYDKNGRITKTINPKGAVKSYEYDALGQLVKVTDEVGAVIQYAYDAAGNIIKTTDANGKITTYAYDELSQPIATQDPSGGTSSVQYDRNGDPTKVIDAKNQTATSEYDRSGLSTKTTDLEGSTTVGYDKDGKATTISSTVNAENIGITYDANNNVTAVQSNLTGNVNSTFNKNDSPVSVQTSSSNIALTYNQNGQVSQVSTQQNSQTLTTQFARDTEGKIITINKPNGDTTFFSYDSSNRTTSVENRNKLRSLLSKYSYQYDKASNITALNDSKTGLTTTYVYDARNQLTKEGARTYSYDPMGNRKTVVDASGTVSYTYDTAGDSNRLLKVTYPTDQTIQFEYDANGNITKRIDSTAGTTLYYYDSDDYFTKAVLPNSTIVQYKYDKVLKLRIERSETKPDGQMNITKFVYSGDMLVSETDQTGKVIRSYAWDEGERLISVSIPNSTGILQTFTYIKNLKEDVVGLSDINGNLVAEYGYDAWGNIVKSTTTAKSTIPNLDKLNPRQYSSYWFDASLGQYFMKTRMYDSGIGRFLSKDQVTVGGSALGYNPYIYCYNNPVGYIDLNGKMAEAVAGTLTLFGGGLATITAPAWLPWVAIGVGVVAAVGYAYWYFAQPRAIPDSNTSTGSISGVGSPMPQLPGNNQNKDNKNTSKNYKSKPKPPSNHVDKIENAKVDPARTIDGSTKPSISRFNPDQSTLIGIASLAKKVGEISLKEAQILMEWAEEYGVRYANHLAGHPNRPYNLPHIEIGPINHITVNIIKLF